MKSRKDYFEEIKNIKIEDKFIEHLIRLVFFTVVISIESIFKRIKGGIFHIKNFFMSRTMSDMLHRYSKYKESVQSLFERTVYRKRLHRHIHDAINKHFSDYEKRLIFGIKGSKESIVTGSRRVITSVKGYTRLMSTRYFEYIPEISVTKKISSAIISIQLFRQMNRKDRSGIDKADITKKIIYLNQIAAGYKQFMIDRYNKFYSEEFKNKISETTTGMKTVKYNVEKMLNTVKRLEQKQVKYRLSNYNS